jgi:hypothetical protein
MVRAIDNGTGNVIKIVLLSKSELVYVYWIWAVGMWNWPSNIYEDTTSTEGILS